MALDPEEYKKRREQREQERQTRQDKQRGVLFKLIIAAAVLIACAVLIIVVTRTAAPAGPASPSTESVLQNPDSQESTSAPSDPSTAPPQTVIRMAFAGDLNINDAVVAAGGLNLDYTEALMDVAHLLGDADITALNFEGVLTGAPYGSSGSAPQTLLTALREAGVDLLQMANSYTIHKGMSGLVTTLSNVRASGLEPMGAYATNLDFRASKGYTVREVAGIRIAFIAFTKGMNGMALPSGNENCVNVLYKDYATTYQDVDSEKILTVLNNARKESPDLIVTMLHWGSEYNDTISKSQQEILELLQGNGVDVILGTHSHYVQQMLYDETAGTFAAYSLGDFLSDTQRSGTEYSVVLELEITKDHTAGDTRVSGFRYTPIFTVNEPEKPLRVVRIKEAMAAYEGGYLNRVSQSTYEAMQYALGRIEARISGE